MQDLTTEHKQLWDLGFRSIKELETDRGILASGRNEVYGCIFGRDSLLTSLTLLRVYEKAQDEYLLNLVRKVLVNLSELQGKEINIESGEEPGKCIHEYRPDKHEHLTGRARPPWYVYPDNIMRNFDTVDATPLFLIACMRYYQASGDETFIEKYLPNILAAIDWVRFYGDTNNDGFIDYRFHKDRSHGGLKTQSWMDSAESVFFEHSSLFPAYPIAPVEVQAYAYVALAEWGNFFAERIHLVNGDLGKDLIGRAKDLKKRFNERFVLKAPQRGLRFPEADYEFAKAGKISLAFALDGDGNELKSARSSMGHVLWAVIKKAPQDSLANPAGPSCILDPEFIPGLVNRLMSRDLFVPRAGIRTLSSRSKRFDPASYHNGSIWPHDTAMLAEGLDNFGYHEAANAVKRALITAYSHFATPIELFAYTRGRFSEYRDANGHGACRVQAWSAASILASLV